MSTPRTHEAIPDLLLERYVLGELPEPEMDRIRVRLSEDHLLRERVRRIEESNAELAARHAADRFVNETLKRLAGPGADPSRSMRATVRTGSWIAAAAVLVLVVLPAAYRSVGWQDTGYPQSTRIKGIEPHLAIYRRVARESERLEDGDVARAGDRIQIVCVAAGARYGGVFSVDGLGALTQHLPVADRKAVSLSPDRPDTLDFAFALDDAPRFERFYFVTSDSAFDLGPLLDAALAQSNSRSAEIAIPDDVHLSIFTLTKE